MCLSTDGSGNLSWISNAGTALSSITAAASGHTIANANNAQVWNWDTLTTGTALKLGSTSLTSGSLLNLSNTNTANSTGSVLFVSNSENAGVNFGIYALDASPSGFAVYGTNAAAAGTGIYGASTGSGAGVGVNGTATGTGAPAGVYGSASGANNTGTGVEGINSSATGSGGYFTNTGGGPALITNAGKVGIGTTSPAAPLHVNGEAIVGMNALGCSSTTAGAIRYNSRHERHPVLQQFELGGSRRHDPDLDADRERFREPAIQRRELSCPATTRCS